MNAWGVSFGNSWGSSFGTASASVVRPSGGSRYFGWTPEPKKKKKKPKVQIAVEGKKIAYVVYEGVPSYAPLLESIQSLAEIIESSARERVIRKKIQDIEDEEDIIIILSMLN